MIPNEKIFDLQKLFFYKIFKIYFLKHSGDKKLCISNYNKFNPQKKLLIINLDKNMLSLFTNISRLAYSQFSRDFTNIYENNICYFYRMGGKL